MKNPFPYPFSSICLIFALFSFSACDTESLLTNKDRAYIKRLNGDWKVANFKQERIQKDGTKALLFDLPNEGSLLVTNCGAISCDYEYTGRREVIGVDGFLYRNFMPSAGAVFIDDTVRRVIFYYAECEFAIGCDRAWTIEKNTSTEQIWIAYFAESTGTHRKLTLQLQK
jgi:hypothetical protein